MLKSGIVLSVLVGSASAIHLKHGPTAADNSFDDVGNLKRVAKLEDALKGFPVSDNSHWARDHETGIGRTGINDYYGKEMPSLPSAHKQATPADQTRLELVEKMIPPPDNLHWARNEKTGIGRTGINDYYGNGLPTLGYGDILDHSGKPTAIITVKFTELDVSQWDPTADDAAFLAALSTSLKEPLLSFGKVTVSPGSTVAAVALSTTHTSAALDADLAAADFSVMGRGATEALPSAIVLSGEDGGQDGGSGSASGVAEGPAPTQAPENLHGGSGSGF